jgi:hypothetical protein
VDCFVPQKTSARIQQLAESGVPSVQALQQGLRAMYECRLERMASRISDVQDRHYQLLQEVKERKELEDVLKAMVSQKQDECILLKTKVGVLFSFFFFLSFHILVTVKNRLCKI